MGWRSVSHMWLYYQTASGRAQGCGVWRKPDRSMDQASKNLFRSRFCRGDTTRMTSTEIRVLWLLRCLSNVIHAGFTVAWDEDTVDAFVKAFPESNKTLRMYSQGPHVSPLLNRTAKIAEKAGFLSSGSVGNEGSRSYNRRTWSRTWTVTESGSVHLANNSDGKPIYFKSHIGIDRTELSRWTPKATST